MFQRYTEAMDCGMNHSGETRGGKPLENRRSLESGPLRNMPWIVGDSVKRCAAELENREEWETLRFNELLVVTI